MTLILGRSLSNIFKEPKASSEVISQAKIGDYFEELDSSGDFVLVRGIDDYKGWILRKDLYFYESPEQFFGDIVLLFEDPFSIVIDTSNYVPIVIPMGSFLPLLKIEEERFIVRLPNGNEAFSYRGRPSFFKKNIPFEKVNDRDKIINIAKSLIGVRYLWGGTTPFGLDCSGFVQLVYRVCGYNLRRDANLQFIHNGEFITPSEAQKGDLVFFSVGREKVDHVAIVLSKDEIIHSTSKYGKVTVEGIERLKKYIVAYKSVIG